MVFKPMKTLLDANETPVDDIFRINDRLVLAVGKEFARVCDITSGVVDREYWYKPGETIYANATYQVQPTTIFTENNRLFNPLNTDVLFANVHGDSLIIGSKSQVALVNSSLEVIETFYEQEIVNVFPGGYATSSKIKQFGKADIELLNIKTAWSDSNMLIVQNGGTNPLYSVGGSRLVECKLCAGFLNKAYDCGAGVIVEAEKSSILFRNNEFVRLKYTGSKCVFTRDLRTCFVLDEGSLHIKANVGMRPTVVVDTCNLAADWSDLASQTQICESKVVRHRQDSTKKHNVVHIQSFDGRIKEARNLPNVTDVDYMYFLLRDKFLLEVSYFQGSGPEKEEPIKVTVYKLSDMTITCTMDVEMACKKYTDAIGYYILKPGPNLKEFIHIDYGKSDIYFAPEKPQKCENIAVICHIDEFGILVQKFPSENQNHELIQEQETTSLTNNGSQNTLKTWGARPLEYPHRGDHILTRGMGNTYYAHKNEGVSITVDMTSRLYETRKEPLGVYTQSNFNPKIYFELRDAGLSRLDLTSSSVKKTYVGGAPHVDVAPRNSVSVVSKSSSAKEYDPEFVVSRDADILGIVPLPETHDLGGIERLISDTKSRGFRHYVDVYQFTYAHEFLKVFKHESSYKRLRDIGEDPDEWLRKLYFMVK